MIYFCADDYGMSKESNTRIENCIINGALNKISVLPNGKIEETDKLLSNKNIYPSLHINLIEGAPLSACSDVSLLVNEEGNFKYSFIGLLLLSLSFKRKEMEEQIYKEIRKQIEFWKTKTVSNESVFIDSHQHTHMIPLVFKALMRVIKDENINIEYLRIPSEPLSPYILTPSLYFSYTPQGIIKQWLLKFLAFVNRKEIKKSRLHSAFFMGVMFSGKMDERKIKKVLPRYIKLAEKKQKDIELGFHPGYFEKGEAPLSEIRDDFKKFYFSPWRKIEYNTLLNIK